MGMITWIQPYVWVDHKRQQQTWSWPQVIIYLGRKLVIIDDNAEFDVEG